MGTHITYPCDRILVRLCHFCLGWKPQILDIFFFQFCSMFCFSFYVSAHCFASCQLLTVLWMLLFSDSDLQDISEFCVSLCYLNLKACTSVTDTGMSILIRRCIKLQSILVCDTSFGRNSILALCCSLPNSGNSVAVDFGNKQQNSVALKLQTRI